MQWYIGHDQVRVQCISGKTQKSGIFCEATDRVICPQYWAHVALKKDYFMDPPAFNDLEFDQLCAGELEIITSFDIDATEKLGRMQLLKKLSYMKRVHRVELIRTVYCSVLCAIECGELTWSSSRADFNAVMQECLMMHHNLRDKEDSSFEDSYEAAATSTDSRVKIVADYSMDAWCWSYNQGLCEEEAPHQAVVRGQDVSVDHFCSKCWSVDREKREHAASDIAACPL